MLNFGHSRQLLLRTPLSARVDVGPLYCVQSLILWYSTLHSQLLHLHTPLRETPGPGTDPKQKGGLSNCTANFPLGRMVKIKNRSSVKLGLFFPLKVGSDQYISQCIQS